MKSRQLTISLSNRFRNDGENYRFRGATSLKGYFECLPRRLLQKKPMCSASFLPSDGRWYIHSVKATRKRMGGLPMGSIPALRNVVF